MQPQIKTLDTVAFNLIKQAVIYLPNDVKNSLNKAYAKETSAIGKEQLRTILENITLAEKHKVPICQDTGTIIFYVKAGAKVKNLDIIEKKLIKATQKATEKVPLRPNAINPFSNKNSQNNIGRFSPQLHWAITDGDDLEITVMIKGGGSENMSALGILNPSDGLKGLESFVLDAVINAGAQPCPPTILGVGIGGGADLSMSLAKKSLLRPLDESNNDPQIAALEKEILETVNMTGIGPMGLGGKTTVIGVHIDYAYRHPASFPVAVVFNCWASRRASARISAKGKVEYLTQKLSGEN